ncbi:hypothetical protein GCM10028777_25000 [Angustibacter speluncae]
MTRSLDPADRFLSASIAANTRWANEPDRTAATSPARAAFNKRFEDEVDPERRLSPEERGKRVENARRAYFMRLALRSAQARRSGRAVA